MSHDGDGMTHEEKIEDRLESIERGIMAVAYILCEMQDEDLNQILEDLENK